MIAASPARIQFDTCVSQVSPIKQISKEDASISQRIESSKTSGLTYLYKQVREKKSPQIKL